MTESGPQAGPSTHEPELTAPVDLCTPDGSRLAGEARGWSRVPLHRANLDGGGAGRNKRWDYWAVLAGDLVLSCVYSDIDVIGLADVWWADLSTGETGGTAIITEPGVMSLPAVCGTADLRVDRDGLRLEIDADDDTGTTLRAAWTESDGRSSMFDVRISRPVGHESINVVIPWSEDTFNFTSKQQALPATGTLTVGGVTRRIGGDADAWGVLDVGRGRWPSEIRWNWGGGAGRSGSSVIGLQFGAKWTEGTGFTENGFLVDGRATKIGCELVWTYDWDQPLQPWTVVDPDGRLSVTLHPVHDKHTDTGSGDLGSEVHQVFGTWSGWVVDDDGVRHEFDAVQGFAEEARQRW